MFSRATGYPFICVSLIEGQLLPREFRTHDVEDESATSGYLIVGDDIWDPAQDQFYLPTAWVQTRRNGQFVPHKRYKDRFPRKLYFDEMGNCSEEQTMKYWGWFMPTPLLFDPTGGVFYDPKTSEGTKLTRLGSEGKSTSTTIMAFLILDSLVNNGYSLQDQKLLSFTDNRQDAALQAGHFNDFIQVVRLRTAIRQAIKNSPAGILDYATLGEGVFTYLDLPFLEYANCDEEPQIAFLKQEYEDVFKEYLFFVHLLICAEVGALFFQSGAMRAIGN